MKGFIERQLRKVVGAKAHDPAVAAMSAGERAAAAAANQEGGGHLTSDLADAHLGAAEDARHAMGTEPYPTDNLVDDTAVVRQRAVASNEEDGSYLETEPVDDTEAAAEDAREAGPHTPPEGDLVNDSDEAKELARRANAGSGRSDKD